MTRDERATEPDRRAGAPSTGAADVGSGERDSLGTAQRSPDEHRAPGDLRDTWNVDKKEWNRPEPAVDPFDDVDGEDVQSDRNSYGRRSGI